MSLKKNDENYIPVYIIMLMRSVGVWVCMKCESASHASVHASHSFWHSQINLL